MPRIHLPLPLSDGLEIALPPAATRHLQVLRLQPGDSVEVFDGSGRIWPATVLSMGRGDTRVALGVGGVGGGELPLPVGLALVVPANDRMDALVEKATELGAAWIQPLQSERSVLRLAGERADKRVAHWQAVAVAAAEQSGRARVTVIRPVRPVGTWLQADGAPTAQDVTQDAAPCCRILLSLDAAAPMLGSLLRKLRWPEGPSEGLICLSGPEGGWTPEEETLARAAGWQPASLGPRTLRADTAPLAALALAAGWL